MPSHLYLSADGGPTPAVVLDEAAVQLVLDLQGDVPGNVGGVVALLEALALLDTLVTVVGSTEAANVQQGGVAEVDGTGRQPIGGRETADVGEAGHHQAQQDGPSVHQGSLAAKTLPL